MKKRILAILMLAGIQFASAQGQVVNPSVSVSDSTGQRAATVASNSGVSLQTVTTLIQNGLMSTAYEPSWSMLVGDPNQTTLPRKITFRSRAVTRMECYLDTSDPRNPYNVCQMVSRPATVLASFRIEANGAIPPVALPAPLTSADLPNVGYYCSGTNTPVGPAIGSHAMRGDANSYHGSSLPICSLSPVISTAGALIGWSMSWFRDYGTLVSATYVGSTTTPFTGPVTRDANACNWTIGGSAGRSCWVAPDIYPEVIWER